jgi:cellulose synthase/poly-beta-1,6-N-acetylglucosamine synthase-like glycosyltransferase
MERTVNGKRADDRSSVIGTSSDASRGDRGVDPQRRDASAGPRDDEVSRIGVREDSLESALFYEPKFLEPKPPETEPHAPADMRLYDYEGYSQLAGPFEEPGQGDAQVSYRRLVGLHPRRRLMATVILLLIQTGFLVWLFQPEHLPTLSRSWILAAAAITMIGTVYLLELFRLVNVATLSIASTFARDPVPIRPAVGSRAAFLTTIVPSREPLEVVRKTLEAALRITHDGPLDIWLLDEEDAPVVRRMCQDLGVRHFSRSGIEKFNEASGPFKTRTKHGNYNSWVASHGSEYEFFVSVDPDHVPLPNFCERLLGYFQDPDVAFVVGPQVYGNYDNLVTKGAESQQFVFHGLLQRFGNYFRCPMLVGTNNAVRIAALNEIGGLRDSITEDMATSLAIHASVNPASGNNWRSVYTPDVLAVGEGPTNFTDFFSQQHRWSRGTIENFRGHYWRCLRSMGWGPRIYYALTTSYYPTAAIGWILGAANCVIFMILGVRGLQIHPRVWETVYVDLAAVQFSMYAVNRRHNVSPHELPGSSGAAGMGMSVMSAPIYVLAMMQTLFNRRQGFVITPKGELKSTDRIGTFRQHLLWAGILMSALIASVCLGRATLGMRLWAGVLIGVCLSPVLLFLCQRVRARLSRVRVGLIRGSAHDEALPVPVTMAPALDAMRERILETS